MDRQVGLLPAQLYTVNCHLLLPAKRRGFQLGIRTPSSRDTSHVIGKENLTPSSRTSRFPLNQRTPINLFFFKTVKKSFPSKTQTRSGH